MTFIIVFFFLRSYDFLQIINDKNQYFGKYCGRKSGINITVTGDSVVLILFSDESFQTRGFQLIFNAVPIGKLVVDQF